MLDQADSRNQPDLSNSNKAMRTLLLLMLGCLSLTLHAQESDRGNVGSAFLFHISYAFQTPGADLAARFGNDFNIGIGVDYLTPKSNWILGLESGYLFGQEVKTNVLATLQTPEGYIIATDRSFADIQLRERGFYVGALLGKILALSSTNPRSGIRVTVGAGLLQHKIRIQDDPFKTVAQLTGDYKKGYDRLTNGLALNEFVGYQLLSTNKRINFFLGFEATQGFTQNRRDFDFDTRQKDETKRIDLLWGIRAGWTLPFYFGKEADEIFY